MPQAIAVSRPNGRVDPHTGERIPGQRINYNNYPGIVDGQDVGYTIGVSEKFEGVDPTNINFKFPLRSYQHGFFESNTNMIAAVKEDIKVLLMTSKGERVINSEIGTRIPTLAGQLFENINIEEMQMAIESEIIAAIDTFMPFVGVQSVVVQDSTTDNTLTENQIRVSMSYILKNFNVEDLISLTISSPNVGELQDTYLAA